jgi:2-oxoisovalerate dehydrogenase E1 component alpha subunit
VCGDGATSQGDFYESVNLAGAWQLPLVFVVNNNQWAISIPRDAQTHCQTLAQKALAGGFTGEQVDGNDVIAVSYVMEKALEKARKGGGPTLIEAITYRLHDHTTADDATRYREKEEVKKAWEQEPIIRLRTYLFEQGHWSEQKEKQLHAECSTQVERAVQEYLNIPAPSPTDIFDYLYASLPHDLIEQREQVIAEAKLMGEHHG